MFREADKDWRGWNSPAGYYVDLVAGEADSLGAVPMYMLYQMVEWGDGNLRSFNKEGFMTNYWDETTATSPNFAEHLAEAQAYHVAFHKPLLWRQTPLGVPNDAAHSGTTDDYRDNRVHYLFAHPQQFVDVGVLGIVFSAGEAHQTETRKWRSPVDG